MTSGGFPSLRSPITTSQVSCALRTSSLPRPGAAQSNSRPALPSTRTDCRRKYAGAEITRVLPAAAFRSWAVLAGEMTLPPSRTSNGYPPAIDTATIVAATGLAAAGATSGAFGAAGGSAGVAAAAGAVGGAADGAGVEGTALLWPGVDAGVVERPNTK